MCNLRFLTLQRYGKKLNAAKKLAGQNCPEPEISGKKGEMAGARLLHIPECKTVLN